MTDHATIGGKARADHMKGRIFANRAAWATIHEGSYCGQAHAWMLPEQRLVCWGLCRGCGQWRWFESKGLAFNERIERREMP